MKHAFSYLSLFLLFVSSQAQVVDGGNGHALVLDRKGHVWASGRNNYGQLGDSSLTSSSIPKKVEGLEGIKAISRGYDHSIALDAQGNLHLWGRNNYGQLGLVSLADQWVPRKLPGHTGFVAAEGGYWHSLGLKENGEVWAWGHNYYGELGCGDKEHRAWPAQVVELRDGIWDKLEDVVQIASVGYHSLALKRDGSVWSWGSNTYRELGYEGPRQPYAARVPGIPPMQMIAVGWHHSVALDREGKLWIWGSDPAFQFKESTQRHYPAPLRLDGYPPFVKIACGSWHSLAIDQDGKLWTWGKNHFGMLGLGDTLSRSLPAQVPGISDVAEIGGGCFQSITVDKQGRVLTFGDNPSGQLGVGNRTRCLSPVAMQLDFQGAPQPEPIAAPADPTSMPQPTPTRWEQPKRIAKYTVLSLSLLLNVWLLVRLRRARRAGVQG